MAGAVVTKNFKPFALMLGAPARQSGWISTSGDIFQLPSKVELIWKFKKTGEIYEFDNENKMVKIIN